MFLSEKDALVYVKDEGDRIHISWIDNDNEVLVFEHIPENYPSTAHTKWETVTEYYNTIKDVDWIMNNISKLDFDYLQELLEIN